MSAVLAWDPGVNGGGAVLGRNGAVLHTAAVRPDMTEKQLSVLVGIAVDVLEMAGGGPAFVEKVQHHTGDGGQGSFTFGGVYKFVLGCLHTRNVIVINVYPQAWQAKMECLTGGNKNVSLAKAKELFPEQFPPKMLKKDALRIADALVIAEYGRRVTQLREEIP